MPDLENTSAEPLAAVKVLVDGATGYVGQHLVHVLRQSGFSVVALTRGRASAADIQWLKDSGAVVQSHDLAMPSDNPELASIFADVDLAVHLIGSIAPRKGETLGSLHGNQAACFAALCQAGGVKRAAMVTALGADRASRSTYLRTKAEAEDAVMGSYKGELVIFRPSLIVGRAVGTRDSKLVKRYITILQEKNMVPLIDGGKNRVQPVYVMDLAKAITAALLRGKVTGVQEIAGAEVLTMRDFVARLSAVRGVDKKVLAVPPLVANLVARVSEKMSDVPVLSVDQALMATMDNVTGANALPGLLGHAPTALADALKTYAS